LFLAATFLHLGAIFALETARHHIGLDVL
jgi:hypothetical protein